MIYHGGRCKIRIKKSLEDGTQAEIGEGVGCRLVLWQVASGNFGRLWSEGSGTESKSKSSKKFPKKVPGGNEKCLREGPKVQDQVTK